MTEPSTNMMIVGANGSAAPEDEEERVFKLQGEIEAERARLKKNPPKSLDAVNSVLTGTVLALMVDMAHYIKENATLTYDLIDQMDSGDEGGTRFTIEDAQKFELVLVFAKETAAISLTHESVVAGSDQHKKLTEIVSTAEECLKILEDGAISEDDDEVTEEAG